MLSKQTPTKSEYVYVALRCSCTTTLALAWLVSVSHSHSSSQAHKHSTTRTEQQAQHNYEGHQHHQLHHQRFDGSNYMPCSFEDILRLMQDQPENFRLLAKYHRAFVPDDMIWMSHGDCNIVLSTIMKGIKQEKVMHQCLYVNVMGKQSELKTIQKV